MSNPVILMRASLAEAAELQAAQAAGFTVVQQRSQVPAGAQVVARYSVLPYYDELQADLQHNGSTLLNTYAQHRYVADALAWYTEVQDLTPLTWSYADWAAAKRAGTVGNGPFVLKGKTNSRKHQWLTHMFASTAADVRPIYERLLDDPLISAQDVIVRQFENFVRYDTGINGLPITDEYRFFILNGEVIAAGYYWSTHYDELLADGKPVTEPPTAWVQSNIAPRLANKIPFVVADVARHEDGRWRLVELNDAQMAGLSCIPPTDFYAALATRLLPGMPTAEQQAALQVLLDAAAAAPAGWRMPSCTERLPMKRYPRY